MTDVTLSISGVPELVRELGRLGAVAVLRAPMRLSLERIWSELQVYPPPARKKFKFKTEKQRRFVLWAIRTERMVVPYFRRHSGGLAGSWRRRLEERGESLLGIVASQIKYGPYVMGPQSQAEYHRGVWPTTADIVREVRPEIENTFERAITAALRRPL